MEDDTKFRLRDIPLAIVGLAMTGGLVAFWGYVAWIGVTGFFDA